MIVNLRLQQEDEEDALISFDMPDPAPYAAIIAEHGLTEASIQVPPYTLRPFLGGFAGLGGWISEEARDTFDFFAGDADLFPELSINVDRVHLALLHFHKNGLVHVELRCDGEWWSEPFSMKDFTT